jgi:hypothetical protein
MVAVILKVKRREDENLSSKPFPERSLGTLSLTPREYENDRAA